MPNSVLARITVFAMPMALLAGDVPGARAATVAECNTSHAVCQGQCASQYIPQNPGPSELCKVGCGTSHASCLSNASDRNAAPPPGRNTKRTPDAAAPGLRPSMLERDAAPAGGPPAPTGRPAGATGAGGPQFK